MNFGKLERLSLPAKVVKLITSSTLSLAFVALPSYAAPRIYYQMVGSSSALPGQSIQVQVIVETNGVSLSGNLTFAFDGQELALIGNPTTTIPIDVPSTVPSFVVSTVSFTVLTTASVQGQPDVGVSPDFRLSTFTPTNPSSPPVTLDNGSNVMDATQPTPTSGGGGGKVTVCVENGGSCGTGGGSGDPASPIIIDTHGDGFTLSSPESGVDFNFAGNGVMVRTSWTIPNSDDVFLVLDRNGNGKVDDGTELFGNYTPQPPSPTPHGYRALAVFDAFSEGGDNDGFISEKDTVFSSLRLWKDVNHNGISEPEELYTLPDLNVWAISLDYKLSKRTDEFGNQFRYRSRVFDGKGSSIGRWSWDVFFSTIQKSSYQE